jgi:cytochrome P450
VLAVLRDPATFSSENPQAPYGARPPEVEQVLAAGLAGESGLLGRNPPDHTRLRAFVNKSLTPRSVAALEPSRATTCRATRSCSASARRFCLGAPLARLEAHVMLHELTQRLPTAR